MRTALLNTTIITNDGLYRCQTISLEAARCLVNKETVSYVGHDVAAKILTELLQHPVAMSREQYSQKPGDCAICFKLKGRAPEGKILTRDEVELMGYEFKLITRYELPNRRLRSPLVPPGGPDRIS